MPNSYPSVGKYEKRIPSFRKRYADQYSFEYNFPLSVNNEMTNSYWKSMFSVKSTRQILPLPPMLALHALGANTPHRVNNFPRSHVTALMTTQWISPTALDFSRKSENRGEFIKR